MNTFLKCIFGELKVRTLDMNRLRKEEDKIFYLKKELRIEILTTDFMSCISIVDPIKFNVQ